MRETHKRPKPRLQLLHGMWKELDAPRLPDGCRSESGGTCPQQSNLNKLAVLLRVRSRVRKVSFMN
jgi:hypothetical protein